MQGKRLFKNCHILGRPGALPGRFPADCRGRKVPGGGFPEGSPGDSKTHDPPLQIARDLQTLGESPTRDFPLGIPGAKGTRYRLHSQRFKPPWRVPNASFPKNAMSRHGQWESLERHPPVGIPGASLARYRFHSYRFKSPWKAPNASFPKNAIPRHGPQVNDTEYQFPSPSGLRLVRHYTETGPRLTPSGPIAVRSRSDTGPIVVRAGPIKVRDWSETVRNGSDTPRLRLRNIPTSRWRHGSPDSRV